MFNFQVRQFRRQDGMWGSLERKTGNWNGMISNLLNGDADFTSIGLVVCCQRTDAVDFTWALSHASAGFVIKSEFFNRQRECHFFSHIHPTCSLN